MESRMRGNSHVRFGAGDGETCLGNEARRFIPTLPANPTGPLPLVTLSQRARTAVNFTSVSATFASGMEARRVKTRWKPGLQRSRQPGPERRRHFLLRRLQQRIDVECDSSCRSTAASSIYAMRFLPADAIISIGRVPQRL
jgi:hypothetical protein